MDAIWRAIDQAGSIWTLLAAAAAILGGLATYLSPIVLPTPLNSLVGDWYSYAYFHDRKTSHFYREQMRLTYLLRWPWILKVVATPVILTNKDVKPTRYVGTCWYRSSKVFMKG